MATPTSRTLEYLRREGWLACVVEKYMHHPGMKFGRRIDAFGFGDILAAHTSGEIALIQACAGGDHTRRRKKLLGLTSEADLARMEEKEREDLKRVVANVRRWLKCGGVVMLISWGKRKVHGRERWTERVELIQLKIKMGQCRDLGRKEVL